MHTKTLSSKVIAAFGTALGLLAAPVSLHAAPPPAKAVASTPYTWRSVQVVGGGFVDGIVFSPAAPDVLYARTDIGGAYRWDAARKQWAALTDWVGQDDWNLTGIESIGVDPTDANRVYLAAGTYTQSWAGNGAILRSADRGRTFQRTDLPFKNGGNEDGRSAGERLAVDPNRNSVLYFGSRNDGLWHSADYGKTWAKVDSFPVTGRTNGIGVVFVVFDRSRGTSGQVTPTLYAGVSQDGPGLYRSTDGGTTWAAVPGQPSGLLPHHGVLDSAGALYVTYGNAPGPNGMSNGAVWKYDTRRAAWADVTPQKPGTPTGFGYAGLAVDAQHPGTVMAATMDRWNPGDTLFRSRDGGKTWTDLGPRTTRDFSLSPYVTFGAKTAKLGWWLGALALDPFRPGHALYGTGATIWASDDVTAADTDGPTHWYVGAKGIEETVVNAVVSPPTGARLLTAMWDLDGFRHTDLTVSPAAGFYQPSFGRDTDIDFAEHNPDIVVRVTGGRNNAHGAWSQDNGRTWTPFAAAPAGRGNGTVAVSADGAAFVCAPEGGGASVSRDRGATWTACAGLPPGAPVVSDRTNPKAFYAFAPDTGAVYASADGGASFTLKSQAAPKGEGVLRAVPGRAGDLWLASADGLYHSTDGGAHFTRRPAVQHGRRIGFGKAAPGRTYPALYLIGTVGGAYGLYRSDTAGAAWVRINDDRHQYGALSAITGDPRTYGRVYISSTNRGTLYGDPARK